MLEPGLYPDRPAEVELRETHISWVFLAGGRAYKVKKPLVLPFLDYGTVERRRQMCHEEVRLNRRLAPSIYLGVLGIAERGNRLEIVDEDDPAAIEFAVEMRRVDERHSLAEIVGRDELDAERLDEVGSLLARFHADADVVAPDERVVDTLASTLEENAETLHDVGADVVDMRRVDAAERFATAFLAHHRDELSERARSGLARDCHGDLRAEHVILPESDPIYIYDCVEFNPSLRRIDVSADLAFLMMDLVALGAESAADRLVAAYRGAGGDPGDDRLLAFFAAYRAWVRAKVACIRAAELQTETAERDRVRAEAESLLALGHRFAWRTRRPAIVVVCGVSGSGKTTLARALADIGGWPYLSSDLTRKRLAGVAPTDRASPETYSAEFTARTYQELGRATREAFDRSGAVIVDATFHRRRERAAFRAGLGDASSIPTFVSCVAPVEVLRSRVMGRGGDPDRVSDADAGVLERQLSELEPLEGERLELDSSSSPDDLVARVESFLDGQ